MTMELLANLLASMLRLATPLILASLAGLLSYQVGLINIALEGFMLAGAFVAVAAAFTFGANWLGILLACVAGGVLGGIFALFVTQFRANLIITGLAINFLALGFTAYFMEIWYGVSGTFSPEEVESLTDVVIPFIHNVPFLGRVFSGHSPLVYISWVMIPITSVFLYMTLPGTYIRATGENPEAVQTAGISATGMRYLALILGGLLCGLAGAHLSMSELGLFRENMTNGRGFIALAAVYFAAGKPLLAAAACLLFGLFEALQFRLQTESNVPPQFFQMLPYIVVVLTLVVISFRTEWRKGMS